MKLWNPLKLPAVRPHGWICPCCGNLIETNARDHCMSLSPDYDFRTGERVKPYKLPAERREAKVYAHSNKLSAEVYELFDPSERPND